MEKTTAYSPHIRDLIKQCVDDWGKPEDNRKLLVPYGIPELDRALYGVDVLNGELVVVQGQEKNRKTTFMANVIANICNNAELVNPPVINIDTLESGMPPRRYRDSLISIMATRYLLGEGHTPFSHCHACGQAVCNQLGITPEFLMYNSRTKDQLKAINYAIATMSEWSLLVHGANPMQGNTRDLGNAYDPQEPAESRWVRLIEEEGVNMFVIDHAQQYAIAGEASSYEKLIKSVSAIGDLVARYNVACFLLTQVSLTSVRESRNGGTLMAAGGSKAAEEANSVISTKYESGSGVMRIILEESRRASSFTLWQPLDDESGCFIGRATTKPIGDID